MYAGWPQQVCTAGTSTTHPASSGSPTAANPTTGRKRSTRQVTSSPTRGPPNRLAIFSETCVWSTLRHNRRSLRHRFHPLLPRPTHHRPPLRASNTPDPAITRPHPACRDAPRAFFSSHFPILTPASSRGSVLHRPQRTPLRSTPAIPPTLPTSAGDALDPTMSGPFSCGHNPSRHVHLWYDDNVAEHSCLQVLVNGDLLGWSDTAYRRVEDVCIVTTGTYHSRRQAMPNPRPRVVGHGLIGSDAYAPTVPVSTPWPPPIVLPRASALPPASHMHFAPVPQDGN